MEQGLIVSDAVKREEDPPRCKLSICIPTLNRGAFIGATLESIVSQATDDVEIIVVDGGSTDGTDEKVREYQTRFPSLRYARRSPGEGSPNSPLPSGKGFDEDCIWAVELARGEYCWLFTDDDLLKPGAIESVLSAVRLAYALVIVNAEVRSADLSTVLQARMLPQYSDRVYKSAENQELFTNVGNYLTFVGGVVIRRTLWNAREKGAYVGSGFIHFGVIFQAQVPEDTLVISDPLIAIRYGNALYMRTSRYFEIWMFTWPNLVWSLPHYSDSARSQLSRKEPWRRKRTLLFFRAKGVFSMKEYRDWLESRLNSRWQRFATRFIARFPGRIANLVAVIRQVVFSREHGAHLVDLVDSPFYFGRGFRWLGGRDR